MSPAHRLPRHLLAGGLLLALVLAVLGLGPGGVATAQLGPPPASSRLLEVVEQTPWVSPGGAFALRLRVHDTPPGARLAYRVHREVLSRSVFVRTLGAEQLGRTLAGPVVAELTEPFVAADGTVLLRIPTGPTDPVEPLVLPGPGVYPVVVDVLTTDDEVVDRLVTHLVLLSEPEPDVVPIAVAVVAPLHAPPAHRSPETTDPVADEIGPLVDAMTAHPTLAVTVIPTPESLAAAVATDPRAAAALGRLAEGRQVIAEPWVRIDQAAWQAAGLSDLLGVQRITGVATAETVLGVAPDLTTAIAGGGTTRQDLATLAALGARAVVVPEADLEPLGDDFSLTLTRPFRIRVGADPTSATVVALAADTLLASHHGSTGQPILDAHHLLADLAVLAGDEPVNQRVAVVALDDDAVRDADFLGALLAGLEPPVGAPGAEAVPVAALLQATTVTDAIAMVEPAGQTGGADAENPLVRAPLVETTSRRVAAGLEEDLRSLEAEVASYRTVFGVADPLAARVSDVALTAGADDLSDSARREVLDAGRAALAAELGLISAPERQRFTLTAREGRVQLSLTNGADRPVDVALELRGDRLELPDYPDGRVQVRLEPGTVQVDLLLRARSSGDAPLDLRVTSPDGRLDLGRTRVTVRTTAVSGVGLVLMGAAAVFLVVWWTRTILRDRRAARQRHPAHAAHAAHAAPDG